MTWLLWLAVAFLYASLAEYYLHRYVMHRRIRGLDGWFVEHHIEHHGHRRMDINVDLGFPLTFVLASPLLLLGYWWLGWPWIIAVAVSSFAYAKTWTCLHRCHHNLGCPWLKSVPGYAIWREHHEAHHQHFGRNFGTVFIWTDRLFGSRMRA